MHSVLLTTRSAWTSWASSIASRSPVSCRSTSASGVLVGMRRRDALSLPLWTPSHGHLTSQEGAGASPLPHRGSPCPRPPPGQATATGLSRLSVAMAQDGTLRRGRHPGTAAHRADDAPGCTRRVRMTPRTGGVQALPPPRLVSSSRTPAQAAGPCWASCTRPPRRAGARHTSTS